MLRLFILPDERPDGGAPGRQVHVPLHADGADGPLERALVRPDHLQARALRRQEPGECLTIKQSQK